MSDVTQVLAAIDAGEIKPHQIVILIGLEDPEHDRLGVKYFIAGPLKHWSLMGMMRHACTLFDEAATA